jgi:hypothetical protein
MPYDLVPGGSSRSIAQPFGVIPPPFVIARGPGEGLQHGVIIIEPDGLVEVIPGTEPGPPTIINEQAGNGTGAEVIG